MSKYVPDIVSHRWVIIAPQRLARPDENGKKAKKKCPFCEGNEKLTSDEVYRIGKGKMNEPGWSVRVVPNKFPITDYHEVIIHSPREDKYLEDMTEKQVVYVLQAYRDRFNFYRKTGQVLIFCNNGEFAGASITHPHSQLVVIPAQINLDTLMKEPINNIVQETDSFTTYCPDFSQWPYEVWITPKDAKGRFGDCTDGQLVELAGILRRMLRQLRTIFHNHQLSNMPFAYNFYIYPGHNWYMRIIPRFVSRAGFELGTGLNVNIVDPSEASLELRGIESRIISVLSTLKKKSS